MKSKPRGNLDWSRVKTFAVSPLIAREPKKDCCGRLRFTAAYAGTCQAYFSSGSLFPKIPVSLVGVVLSVVLAEEVVLAVEPALDGEFEFD
jgi:hypothetical protein